MRLYLYARAFLSLSLLTTTAEWLIGVVLGVEVVATTGANCSPGWDWANNAEGQTPCLVAAYLQSVCTPETGFDVPSLPPTLIYPSPTGSTATDCACNSVVYSLMSACAACQNGTSVTWGDWMQNCTSMYTSAFPEIMPNGTSVPSWAYLSVTAEDNWDEIRARGYVVDSPPPDSTVGNVPTSSFGMSMGMTSSMVSTTFTAFSSSTTPSNTSLSSSKKHTDIGAVVGGAVGGALLVTALAALTFYFVVIKRRKARQEIMGSPETEKPLVGAGESVQPSVLPMLYQKPMITGGSYVPPNASSAAISYAGIGAPAFQAGVPHTMQVQAQDSPFVSPAVHSMYGPYGGSSRPPAGYNGVPEAH